MVQKLRHFDACESVCELLIQRKITQPTFKIPQPAKRDRCTRPKKFEIVLIPSLLGRRECEGLYATQPDAGERVGPRPGGGTAATNCPETAAGAGVSGEPPPQGWDPNPVSSPPHTMQNDTHPPPWAGMLLATFQVMNPIPQWVPGPPRGWWWGRPPRRPWRGPPCTRRCRGPFPSTSRTP